MKYIKEFLLERDEDLRDLMRDLETMGYEDLYTVGISGRMVEDFGEGAFSWKVTASGEGKSKEEALLRAISVAIQSIESFGRVILLSKGKEIEIKYEVLQKGIRDKQIAVEEIGYESFTDGLLKIEVEDFSPKSSEKGAVGIGSARRIQPWE